MTLQDCLQWWNVIYLAPLAISLVWILATAMGGIHAGSVHAGAHGIGHGHDFGHGHIGHGHVGHGHVGHGDGGHAHAHANGDSHNGHESGTAQRVLSVLGFGEAPVGLLIGIFMFCWGVFGMSINQTFESIGRVPLVYVWPSLIITFVASYAVTRIMAAFICKMLPAEETFGVSRRDLVGSVGKAVFTVSLTGGTVDIKDKYGTIHRAQARTTEDESSIMAGTEVLVVDYDDTEKEFVVKSVVF